MKAQLRPIAVATVITLLEIHHGLANLIGSGLEMHPLVNVSVWHSIMLITLLSRPFILTFLLSLAEDCGPLSDPVNGRVVTPNGTTFGFQASYNCNEGFFISAGSPIRSCEANGVWSGFEPTCMSKYLPTSVVNRQGWRAHFVFRY